MVGDGKAYGSKGLTSARKRFPSDERLPLPQLFRTALGCAPKDPAEGGAALGCAPLLPQCGRMGAQPSTLSRTKKNGGDQDL